MTPQQIASLLQEQFGERILAAIVDKHPRVHIDADDWREVAEFVFREPRLQLDWLANHTGIDYVADGKMCCVYDLYSFALKHHFAIKVYCNRATPIIPSVVDLWPAANWHEREAFDLLGIDFPGHPDLRRILLSDDWEGFPLRKDYIFPREYHGIPGSVELDWQQEDGYPKQ